MPLGDVANETGLGIDDRTEDCNPPPLSPTVSETTECNQLTRTLSMESAPVNIFAVQTEQPDPNGAEATRKARNSNTRARL